jgi:hypothetical protein
MCKYEDAAQPITHFTTHIRIDPVRKCIFRSPIDTNMSETTRVFVGLDSPICNHNKERQQCQQLSYPHPTPTFAACVRGVIAILGRLRIQSNMTHTPSANRASTDTLRICMKLIGQKT